jgi:hypothetical protein
MKSLMKFANIEEAFSRQLFLQAEKRTETIYKEASFFFTFMKITVIEEDQRVSTTGRLCTGCFKIFTVKGGRSANKFRKSQIRKFAD